MSKDESNNSISNSQTDITANDSSLNTPQDEKSDLIQSENDPNQLLKEDDSTIKSDLLAENGDINLTNTELNTVNKGGDIAIHENTPPEDLNGSSDQGDILKTGADSPRKDSESIQNENTGHINGDFVDTTPRNVHYKLADADEDVCQSSVDAKSEEHNEEENSAPQNEEEISAPKNEEENSAPQNENTDDRTSSVKSETSVLKERNEVINEDQSESKVEPETAIESRATPPSSKTSTPRQNESDLNNDNTTEETKIKSIEPVEQEQTVTQDEQPDLQETHETASPVTEQDVVASDTPEVDIVNPTEPVSEHVKSEESSYKTEDTERETVPTTVDVTETHVESASVKGEENNLGNDLDDKSIKESDKEEDAKQLPAEKEPNEDQSKQPTESQSAVTNDTLVDNKSHDNSTVNVSEIPDDLKVENQTEQELNVDESQVSDNTHIEQPKNENGAIDLENDFTKVVISDDGVPEVSDIPKINHTDSSEENSVIDETEKSKTEPTDITSIDQTKRESLENTEEEIPEEIGTKRTTEAPDPNDGKAEIVEEEDIKQNSDSDKESQEQSNTDLKKDSLADDNTAQGKADDQIESMEINQVTTEDTSEDRTMESTADTENKSGTEEVSVRNEEDEKEETNDALENKNVTGTEDLSKDNTNKEETEVSENKSAESTKTEVEQPEDSVPTTPKEDIDNTESTPSSDSNKNIDSETSKPVEENKPEEKVKVEERIKSPEPVKVVSPLDLLLEKNVEIEGNIDTLTELETKVVTLLVSMKNVMSHYSEVLKLQALKDFTLNLGKFRGDFETINGAFKRWSEMSANINKHLKELRFATDDAKTQMGRKYQQEDLSTWIDPSPEKEKEKELLQEETIAAEKAAMAKVAEARHAVATAATGVVEAQQFMADMEKQVAEAEAMSVKAAALAKAALVTAEEARIAAEERRRAEEAAKKRAEERARIKAAEQEKKQAEDEIKIYQEAAKKGTCVEDERKSFMEEKARREAERRNPKNWPRFSYKVQSVDFKPSIGCIVRAIEGSMRKTDVTCKNVDQSNDILKLGDSEELVSNIVTIKQTDEELNFVFEESISVALPISLSRVPTGKETVVKQLTTDGKWLDLATSDVQFDDYRELKFVEGRSKSFGTFAVTLKPKKDQLQLTRRGNKVSCSFDSRLSLTNKSGTLKTNTNIVLEASAIDINAISDLKVRSPKECEALLTASPFITLRMPKGCKFEKPIIMTAPLPQTQTRQKRPTTGITREMKTPETRPQTARTAITKEEDPTEEVHFLQHEEKTGWTVNRKISLVQPKNKDIVAFELGKPYDRILLLRTKIGKRDMALEKMANLLEQTSRQRNVKIILRQRNDDVSEVKVVCIISNKADRSLKHLEEEGYTEGPAPSADLVLKEGQKLYMKFRGNIHCVSEDPLLSFMFNSNVRAVREFKVDEKDIFAQKALQCYRGFVQVFTKAKVPNPIPDDAPKNTLPEMVEAEILLTELLIELPKPEATPPKPLATAPMSLKEGPLTNGVLRMIAGQLGKEWKDLAGLLNLKPMRIQAILRQHVNKDTPDTRYEMLLTWAKRVPRAVDKVQILQGALHASGRIDLADEVRQRGQRYKQQRFMNARVSHLKQAFVKVAKTTSVFNKWKSFAKDLGVPDEEIERIDASGGSGQEKCFTSLETWKDKSGEEATVTVLAHHLREVKQDKLSKDVESVLA